jgi:hypothetical protein
MMLFPNTEVWPWSELPNEDTTTSRLVSPLVTWAIPTQQMLLDPVEMGPWDDTLNPPDPLPR